MARATVTPRPRPRGGYDDDDAAAEASDMADEAAAAALHPTGALDSEHLYAALRGRLGTADTVDEFIEQLRGALAPRWQWLEQKARTDRADLRKSSARAIVEEARGISRADGEAAMAERAALQTTRQNAVVSRWQEPLKGGSSEARPWSTPGLKWRDGDGRRDGLHRAAVARRPWPTRWQAPRCRGASTKRRPAENPAAATRHASLAATPHRYEDVTSYMRVTGRRAHDRDCLYFSEERLREDRARPV